jgi:hypothetical protein
MKVEIGDILELRHYDTNEIILERVTSVENKDTDDDEMFQVRTENMYYDFINFYEVVNIYNRYKP